MERVARIRQCIEAGMTDAEIDQIFDVRFRPVQSTISIAESEELTPKRNTMVGWLLKIILATAVLELTMPLITKYFSF